MIESDRLVAMLSDVPDLDLVRTGGSA